LTNNDGNLELAVISLLTIVCTPALDEWTNKEVQITVSSKEYGTFEYSFDGENWEKCSSNQVQSQSCTLTVDENKEKV
jgi:hypothetical protein